MTWHDPVSVMVIMNSYKLLSVVVLILRFTNKAMEISVAFYLHANKSMAGKHAIHVSDTYK